MLMQAAAAASSSEALRLELEVDALDLYRASASIAPSQSVAEADALARLASARARTPLLDVFGSALRRHALQLWPSRVPERWHEERRQVSRARGYAAPWRTPICARLTRFEPARCPTAPCAKAEEEAQRVAEELVAKEAFEIKYANCIGDLQKCESAADFVEMLFRDYPPQTSWPSFRAYVVPNPVNSSNIVACLRRARIFYHPDHASPRVKYVIELHDEVSKITGNWIDLVTPARHVPW